MIDKIKITTMLSIIRKLVRRRISFFRDNLFNCKGTVQRRSK